MWRGTEENVENATATLSLQRAELERELSKHQDWIDVSDKLS
jgi:hypothetical protein